MSKLSSITTAAAAYAVAPAVITITNLRLRTYIGFNDEEISKQQDVVINIKISYEADQAYTTDNELTALNYKVLIKKIINHVEQGRFRLLEKLTADLLSLLMKEDRVIKADVTVDKPNALRFSDSVAITLAAEKI